MADFYHFLWCPEKIRPKFLNFDCPGKTLFSKNGNFVVVVRLRLTALSFRAFLGDLILIFTDSSEFEEPKFGHFWILRIHLPP